MGVSDFGSRYITEGACFVGQYSDCLGNLMLLLTRSILGSLPIIIIGEDVWSAFRKKKHWIPSDSLVLGAFALQLLALLNNSFDFSRNVDEYSGCIEWEVLTSRRMCNDLSNFLDNWLSVLSGRVSVCVLMGCLLPGVAQPLSKSLWSDMAALIISSSIFLCQVCYEAKMLASTFHFSKHASRCDPEVGMLKYALMQWANVTIIVSIIFLLFILGSSAMASVIIHQIIPSKIPTIFSLPNLYRQFAWEKVEEHITKSYIVVVTSDPQYIMSRSCLSSSVALIISICNGVLICHIFLFGISMNYNNFGFLSPCVVTVIGSIVIYWRCITQVVYYPKSLEWKCSSFLQYFHIEDFWKSHLLGLIYSSRDHGQLGKSCLPKLISRLCSVIRMHKLLDVLLWLQMLSVLFSKLCCLLLQLLLSNKYFGKLIMGSAYQEFSDLYRSEIRLGESSDYHKYFKSLVNIQGENSAGLWIANRKSIGQVKKRMAKGEEEGKNCSDLISLLREKSSPDFCGEKCVKPQNDLLNRLEVERELDVRKCSCKMAAISIVAVIIELSSCIDNKAEAEIMANRAIEACSQAWSIMEVVENNASEAIEVCIAADEIFQNLQKWHRWLDCRLPLSRVDDRSPALAAVKAAIQNVVDKGKETANQSHSSKPIEAIAGYSLYRIGNEILNQYHQFESVDEISDRMYGMLADVMGSCCVKAAGVIMQNCKKLAIMVDEEIILRMAQLAGKVKGVTESIGWTLKWSSYPESLFINTSLARYGTPTFRRYRTFPDRVHRLKI